MNDFYRDHPPADPPAPSGEFLPSRRAFLAGAAVTAAATTIPLPALPKPLITEIHTRLTVNGKSQELSHDSRATLLDTLREQLHLSGTKKGCDHGQCGACTVLLNGRRVLSCLTLAASCDGDKVTTIEGLGSEESLHPMQQAFIDQDAFQCGYCTPGQICSAVGMLKEVRSGCSSYVGHKSLTDAEIRERMSGNICRCGAYLNIVKAIRQAEGA